MASYMIDINGYTLDDYERNLLNHPRVGAVILFTKNFLNREQLLALTQSIHATNPQLFITVDHEGGYIQRFQRHRFRALPSARHLGELYDMNPAVGLQAAFKYGHLMATDLMTCGIDLSLAPVLDLDRGSDIIGGLDRALHTEPMVVTYLAEAFIKGMQEAGMPCVGKHFPGHGSFLADSHLTKPIYEASYPQLEANDLKPFIELIKRQRLDAIMPAHVTYPQIDASHPAGFSSTWLHHILRQQLNFKGMILSDCLSMAGAEIGDLKTRAHAAFSAGCDMAILCNQSRETLEELLNEEMTYSDNEGILQAFKQKMVRFNRAHT